MRQIERDCVIMHDPNDVADVSEYAPIQEDNWNGWENGNKKQKEGRNGKFGINVWSFCKK